MPKISERTCSKNLRVFFPITKSYVTEKETAEVPKGSRIVEGFIATSHQDEMGDIITEEALREFASGLQERPTMLLNHDSDRPIGRMVDVEVRHLNDGQSAIWVKDFISAVENEIWTKVLEGTISQYSIRGLIRDYKIESKEEDEEGVRHITSLFALEHSLVSIPVNANANTIGAYVAKAFESDVSASDFKGQRTNEMEGVLKDVMKDSERRGILTRALSGLGRLFGSSSNVPDMFEDKNNEVVSVNEGDLPMEKSELLRDREFCEKVESLVDGAMKKTSDKLISEVTEKVSSALIERFTRTLEEDKSASTKQIEKLTKTLEEGKSTSIEQTEKLTKTLEESEKVSKELTEKLAKSEETQKALEEKIVALEESGGESAQGASGHDLQQKGKDDLALAFFTTGVGSVPQNK